MSKKKLIFSLVVTSFSIVFCGTVNFANASSVVEVCRLDAKIINVTEGHVFVDIAGIKIYNKSSVLCADINKNNDYKMIRDNFLKNSYRESIFVGQNIIIDGVSGNAMGPDGPVYWESWELESAGNTTIKLPIAFEKNPTLNNSTQKTYSVSEFTKLKKANGDYQVKGFVTKNNPWPCPPCPKTGVCSPCLFTDELIITDTTNAKDSFSLGYSKYGFSPSEFKVGSEYVFTFKVELAHIVGDVKEIIRIASFYPVSGSNNLSNDYLIEGRTYTVAELNKNASITPRKFFTEAYVVMNYQAIPDFDGNIKFNFLKPEIVYAEAQRPPDPVNVLMISDKQGNITNEIRAGRELYPHEIQLNTPHDRYKNLKINQKYRFELIVGKFANIDKNNIGLVSVKNLDGTALIAPTSTSPVTQPPTKQSFFARIWNWFAGLFKR